MTGNPIDLDEKALREAIAQSLDACATFRHCTQGVAESKRGAFNDHVASLAMLAIKPLIAELRQHREAQQGVTRYEYSLTEPLAPAMELTPLSLAFCRKRIAIRQENTPNAVPVLMRRAVPDWQPVTPEETP